MAIAGPTPRYEIVGKLADGAAAEVFLARGPGLGEPVVLKVLRQELTVDPEVLGRFLDEAKICRQLDHPGVVKLLDAGRFPDGRVYLVHEHLEGKDLSARLKLTGPLTPDEFIQMAVPLCEALEHVHQRGVVHRDLKPDNIFLTNGQASRPKLLDFGLALFHGPKSVRTATGVILTTPEYIPPECIDGQKADARSDLYSLGVLLYEALTGSPPFVAANYGELLLKHLREPPPPLPSYAEHLGPPLQRCLAKSPQDRYPSAGELRRDLMAISSPDEGTSISRPGKKPVHQGRTPPPTDESFGPYKALKVLGEGGMGCVYLAKHSKLGRQVALKTMRPEHSRNRDLVERFFQEARTVNEINHEHIVEIFDFVEDADARGEPRVYCVMELLTGRTLADLSRLEPLSIKRVVHIGAQICSALAAAHQVGVVHRDIKPENIFITERSGLPDYVKVLDFGVAKMMAPVGDVKRPGTMAGTIIGTPTYMAPEQASGLPTDHRADIYALGVVFYELLTGRVPFDGQSFGQLLVQIMTQPPPPIGEKTTGAEPIPARLRELVLRCLEKDAGRRPQQMSEVRSELLAIASELGQGPAHVPHQKTLAGVRSASGPKPIPLVNVTSPPEEEIKLPPSRGRWVALGAAALALAGGGAFLAFRGPSSPPPAPAAPAASSAPAEPAPVAAPTPPPPPPPPPVAPVPEESAQVEVEVRSRPPGAQVTRRDTGELLGQTPVTLKLPRAESEVPLLLSLDGYEPLQRSVKPSRDMSMEVALAVLKKPARKPAGEPRRRKERVSDESTVDPFEE
jgi:serine/threonine-protein kinase